MGEALITRRGGGVEVGTVSAPSSWAGTLTVPGLIGADNFVLIGDSTVSFSQSSYPPVACIKYVNGEFEVAVVADRSSYQFEDFSAYATFDKTTGVIKTNYGSMYFGYGATYHYVRW